MLSAARLEATAAAAPACADTLAPPLSFRSPTNATDTTTLKATVDGAAATDALMDAPTEAAAPPPEPRLAASPPAASDVATPVTVNATVVDEGDDAAAAKKTAVAHDAGGADAAAKTTLEAGTPSADPIAAARNEAFAQPPGAKEMFSDDDTGRAGRAGVGALVQTTQRLRNQGQPTSDAPLKVPVTATVLLRLPYAAAIAAITAVRLKALAFATGTETNVTTVYDGGDGGAGLGGRSGDGGAGLAG